MLLLRYLVWPIQHFIVKQSREALLRLNGLTFLTSTSSTQSVKKRHHVFLRPHRWNRPARVNVVQNI